MPVYSMTGYASALGQPPQNPDQVPAPQLAVELRSVNGRFLDLSLRLPDELRHLEPPIRDAIAQGIRRGKVELRIAAGREGDHALPRLNPGTLDQLAELQSQLRARFPSASPFAVQELLHWCRQGSTQPAWDDGWLLKLVQQCVDGLREARAREGDRLTLILLDKIAQLRVLAERAEPLVPAVVQRHQERFLQRWQEALNQAGALAHAELSEAARERALSEAAAHAIRIDVAEELARLRAHLDEIEAQLRKGGELGKRLDFLIQELHREANTLGSKSTALELSAISVDMKVLIEQMREQVQNIE
ncbi:YicC/YloC family endoribonuclease [Inhella proteolytica]|uniref:YicC family protein n=1 Tax=Inhella proteolytica TaxID=2795029 RepID=A0A931J5T3_9BURK|nr:YicC/YloC family endoribonuclease [Inhella proteolytica]MBH9578725.1 YicC family protein [Inhella proteolytica]